MTAVRCPREAALATRRSLRWAISVAVLIASSGISPAIPLGQAAGAVGPVVPPAGGAASPTIPSGPPPVQTPAPPQIPGPPQAPLPPQAPAKPPPAPPQAPAHVPAPPRAPAKPPPVPQAPAKIPPAPQAPPAKVPSAKGPETAQNPPDLGGSPSSGSTRNSSPSVDLPSVHEITPGGTKKPTGVATSNSTQAQQTAVAAPNGLGESSGNHSTTRLGIRAGSSESESAGFMPLRHLMAYVWPAIALGPVGELLARLQARWEAGVSFPAVVAGVARLLSGATGAIGASEAVKRSGLTGRSELSASPNPSHAGSRGFWVPGGGEISLLVLIVSCAALMALLVITVGRELRAIYRWPL